MSTHPDPEQLSAYVDGELTGADRDDLEQHLTGCSQCSATLRALRATLADMRALPSPAPSEQESWALRAAITKARKKPAERYRRWVIAASGVAAVAIAVVVISTTGTSPKKTEAGTANSSAAPPVLGGQSGTAAGTTPGERQVASSFQQNTYFPQIQRCERLVLSKDTGNARAIAYIIGRYDSTPAFFLIYSLFVGGKSKTEMWVVQRSDCYIRLFLAPQ
ncbi:MAG: hypothetical protein E6G04_09365 [Actinobacteria bacterium]|nr:MAG: hypothetical protein E6G04_09365 [Actinomycetota bacterium]